MSFIPPKPRYVKIVVSDGGTFNVHMHVVELSPTLMAMVDAFCEQMGQDHVILMDIKSTTFKKFLEWGERNKYDPNVGKNFLTNPYLDSDRMLEIFFKDSDGEEEEEDKPKEEEEVEEEYEAEEEDEEEGETDEEQEEVEESDSDEERRTEYLKKPTIYLKSDDEEEESSEDDEANYIPKGKWDLWKNSDSDTDPEPELERKLRQSLAPGKLEVNINGEEDYNEGQFEAEEEDAAEEDHPPIAPWAPDENLIRAYQEMGAGVDLLAGWDPAAAVEEAAERDPAAAIEDAAEGDLAAVVEDAADWDPIAQEENVAEEEIEANEGNEAEDEDESEDEFMIPDIDEIKDFNYKDLFDNDEENCEEIETDSDRAWLEFCMSEVDYNRLSGEDKAIIQIIHALPFDVPLSDWDLQFFLSLSFGEAHSLLVAARILNVPDLQLICGTYIGLILKGKTKRQIKKLLNSSRKRPLELDEIDFDELDKYFGSLIDTKRQKLN